MTSGIQPLKSTHTMPRNKPVSSYLSSSLFLTCPHGTKKFLGPKAVAFLPRHSTQPHPLWTPLRPSQNTHLCPHWQTSPASLPHTVGPLLLRACARASRGRHSGLSPALTYEAQRCSCNALLLDTTKSTCSIMGRRGNLQSSQEGHLSHRFGSL